MDVRGLVQLKAEAPVALGVELVWEGAGGGEGEGRPVGSALGCRCDPEDSA